MAPDSESTGKSKGRTGRRAEAHLDQSIEQDGRLDANGLETVIEPRASDLSARGLDASANWATA